MPCSHLAENYPDIKKHLFNDDGTTRAFVNVYVNDEDSRYLQAGATPVKDGDTLTIVPSIAGGLDAVGRGRLAVVSSGPEPGSDGIVQ